LELKKKTILITGCSGFLGSHLAKSLAQQNKLRVRGLIKNRFVDIERIRNLPIDLVYGDMISFEAMMDATRDCDFVVHCAIGNPYETIIGTKNVIGAAWKNLVKKFILISSSAVFGCSPSFDFVQKERLDRPNHRDDYYTPYSVSKIVSERIAFAYHDIFDFPIVILRPTNIYGADSFYWTIKPIMMLQQGCYVLVDGGLTPSNVVHVDDVVTAIELAILRDEAIGHAMTISNSEVTSWKKLFTSYSRMFPNPPALLNIDKESIANERKRQEIEFLKNNILSPTRFFSIIKNFSNSSKLMNEVVSLGKRFSVGTNFQKILSKTIAQKKLQKKAREGIKRKQAILENQEYNPSELFISKIPELWLEKAFTLPFQFPFEKARRVLEYKPKTSFRNKMEEIYECLSNNEVRPGFAACETIFDSSASASVPLIFSRRIVG